MLVGKVLVNTEQMCDMLLLIISIKLSQCTASTGLLVPLGFT